MDSLRGKTLRWTFTDGPVAGTLWPNWAASPVGTGEATLADYWWVG